MNPDTIGCVWTDEFDLNTLRVDGEIFESGKKKLRIRKYPDTCGRGLSVQTHFVWLANESKSQHYVVSADDIYQEPISK